MNNITLPEYVYFKTFVVGPLQTNMSILGDKRSNQAILIDPGGENITQYIKESGMHIVQTVITHGHFDHFLGVSEAKAYSSSPSMIGLHQAGSHCMSISSS